MAVDFGLLPIIVIIFVVAAAGLLSGSIYVAAGAGVLVIGWAATQVNNTFLTGLWYLILVAMSLVTARMGTKFVIGDTA